MNAPQTPYERFMAYLPTYAAQRAVDQDWRLYDRVKADFMAACHGVTPEQYENAIRAITRACGV